MLEDTVSRGERGSKSIYSKFQHCKTQLCEGWCSTLQTFCSINILPTSRISFIIWGSGAKSKTAPLIKNYYKVQSSESRSWSQTWRPYSLWGPMKPHMPQPWSWSSQQLTKRRGWWEQNTAFRGPILPICCRHSLELNHQSFHFSLSSLLLNVV